MYRAALLIPFALLVPVDAYACINSMMRSFTDPIATQPLEYLHFGIFLAAVVLLRWRGQPTKEELTDAAELPGDDDHRPAAEPSLERQFAFLAICIIASFGVGLVAADVIEFGASRLTERAFSALGFLSVGMATSLLRNGSTFLAVLRKALLIIALVAAFFGAKSVWNGEVSYDKHVDGWGGNVELQHQVTF